MIHIYDFTARGGRQTVSRIIVASSQGKAVCIGIRMLPDTGSISRITCTRRRRKSHA